MVKQNEEKKSLGLKMEELKIALGMFIEDPLVCEILKKHEVLLEHLVKIVEDLTNKSRFDLK